MTNEFNIDLKLRSIEKNPLNEIETKTIQQEAIMSRLNCHNIGRILEFDVATQTCTVELMQLKKFNSRIYAPAPITQVPLIIYGAGNGHITLPNPEGSICLLFFNDRNMDNFMLTGEQYLPDTTRMHDFTDCIAITTFKTLANPLTDYDERAVSIKNEEIIEEIKYSSSFKVYGNSIIANTTDYTVNADNEITNASGLGGQITIGEKVSIQNSTQNLNLLIQAFIAACEGITTITGGGLTPASLQAFTDLKTQFEELLE